jgi:hypothetical protein
MHQWIILSISAAGLLAMLALLVYKALRHVYPEGKRYTKKWEEYTLHLIIHKQANLLDQLSSLRIAALTALKSVVTAHTEMRELGLQVSGSVAPVERYFKEYIVYVIPESLMLPGCAAYTKKINGIPSAVVSDKDVLPMIEFGEPIIHEMCHVVLNDYRASEEDHLDPTIWMAAGALSSLQFIARGVYKELSITLGIR